MQSQLVCAGCRNILLYPRGATNVRCAICSTVTPASDMPQLVCGGCRALLMYAGGASSVRCSCCNTITTVRPAADHVGHANQVAQVNCDRCRTTLMYPYGAPSVKCAVCQFVTNIGVSFENSSQMICFTYPTVFVCEMNQISNTRWSILMQRPNGSLHAPPSTSVPPSTKSHTVVVENPMSVDGSGKLVSNVAVGVTTEKK